MKKALFLAIPLAAATATICIMTARRKNVPKLTENPSNTSPHVSDESSNPAPYYAMSQIWQD